MEINKKFFTSITFFRDGIYWKVFDVSYISASGSGWDAILECKQVFPSKFKGADGKLEYILNTLLVEIGIENDNDCVELHDGNFLNIIDIKSYEGNFLQKRFIVNHDNRPLKIGYGEFINRISHDTNELVVEQSLK